MTVAAALLLTSAPSAQAVLWPIGGPVASAPDPDEPVLTPEETAALEAELRADVEEQIRSDVSALLKGNGLGSAYSVDVVDVASGESIYSRSATTARTAASNTKLFTAAAALESLGPTKTFTTKAVRAGRSRTVTLVAGGDPRMTNARLRSLATQTAADLAKRKPATTKLKGKRTRVVNVRLDDRVFKGATKLASWRQGGYGLGTIQPVRGIARTTSRTTDSSASAAKAYAKYLGATLGKGWTVRYVGRAAAPTKVRTAGVVRSDTVETLVKRMLLVSDNQVAEVLHRHVGRSQGYGGSFAGGAKGTRKVMKKLGVDLGSSTFVDGSGLSPANRITARALTNLLVVAADPNHARLHPILYTDWSLPLAGRTGTLASRFAGPATCARGEVAAKTGSLDYEIALSGYTVGADDRLKAFSVVANELRTWSSRQKARTTADQLASAVYGCL